MNVKLNDIMMSRGLHQINDWRRLMITKIPDDAVIEQWKHIFEKYNGKLKPNRISGIEFLNYLQAHYILTEIYDEDALRVVCDNIIMNEHYKEKLPVHTSPIPKAFYLENLGQGEKFYCAENKDSEDIWGGDIARIFIAIDIITGFYTVEGSTMLYDELYAIRGLDEKDLQNFVIVAQYIKALQKLDILDKVIME